MYLYKFSDWELDCERLTALIKETKIYSSQKGNGGNLFCSAGTANNPSNSPFLGPYN